MIFKEQRVLNVFLRKQIVATMRNGMCSLCIRGLIDVKDGETFMTIIQLLVDSNSLNER
jgi:hypothetical protein